MVFRFKKFEITQQKSAMKVGTDGVLLGAWANYNNPVSILDIGTGTGLIALMLAQRFSDAKITAIEIDKAAADEAKQNFEVSPWSNRLSIMNCDFIEWEAKLKFDLIVCNPPYFKSDLRSPDKQRALARNGVISGSDILVKAFKFMHKKSQICFIIPFDQLTVYQENAKVLGLVMVNTLSIKPTPQKAPNRVLVAFGFGVKLKFNLRINELTIEQGGRHQYSEAYKMMTKDFYLNF